MISWRVIAHVALSAVILVNGAQNHILIQCRLVNQLLQTVTNSRMEGISDQALLNSKKE